MNGKAWTDADKATLERLAGKYTDAEIAGQTGHCESTILKRRQALGLPSCKRKDWTQRRWRQNDKLG